MKRWKKLALTAVISAVVSGFYFSLEPPPFSAAETVDRLQASEGSIIAAYHREASTIIETYGIEAALQTIGVMFERNKIDLNGCHALAHRTGHDAITVYGDDFEALLDHASEFCARGYWHGAEAQIVLERVDFVERLGRFCDALKNRNPEVICFHGAGHAILNQTLDVQEALKWCDVILESHEREHINHDCYEGVFSELTVILGGHDGETGLAFEGDPPISIDVSPLEYCGLLEQRHQSACAYELNGLHLHPTLPFAEAQVRLDECAYKAANAVIAEACMYNVSSSDARHRLALADEVPFHEGTTQYPETLRHIYIRAIAQEMAQHIISGRSIDTDGFCESTTVDTDVFLCKERVAQILSDAERF